MGRALSSFPSGRQWLPCYVMLHAYKQTYIHTYIQGTPSGTCARRRSGLAEKRLNKRDKRGRRRHFGSPPTGETGLLVWSVENEREKVWGLISSASEELPAARSVCLSVLSCLVSLSVLPALLPKSLLVRSPHGHGHGCLGVCGCLLLFPILHGDWPLHQQTPTTRLTSQSVRSIQLLPPGSCGIDEGERSGGRSRDMVPTRSGSQSKTPAKA